MAEPTLQQRDAFSQLRGIFEQYGLGGLTDWLWQQIVSGEPESSVMLNIREQPAVKERFPANEARKKLGLPPLPFARYVETESAIREVLRRKGQDVSRMKPKDFLPWMIADTAPGEVEKRFDLYERTQKVYAPRLRNMLLSNAGIDINTDDAFGMITGQRKDLMDLYAKATGTAPLTEAEMQKLQQGGASLSALELAEQKAIMEEKSQFASGGTLEADRDLGKQKKTF